MSPLEEIAHFAEVPVEVEARLDQRIMTIRQVLELSVNSVIKMTRSAGENIDILIGNALVGFGEIVIIEETVGVRITDFQDQR